MGRAEGLERGGRGIVRRAWLDVVGLGSILLAVAVGHLCFIRSQPTPSLSGDETGYAREALEYAATGATSLLPGRLPFDERLWLISRIYSHLGGETVEQLVERIGRFQLVLLLGLVAATWTQARLLGIGRPATFLATLLLGSFPWLGFYVHALWPEVLHALWVALACLACTWWLRDPAGSPWRLPALTAAGLALGYALLTKGSVNLFLGPLLLYVAAATFVAAEGRPWIARSARALVAAAALAAGIALVAWPQLARNAADGFGYRFSANRWRNIELGVRSTHPGDEALTAGLPGKWGTRDEITQQYKYSDPDMLRREELSEQRVRRHLKVVPLLQLARVQASKLLYVLLEEDSFFEKSLGKRARWSEDLPPWVPGLRWPARIEWYLLWPLGVVGLLLTWRSSAGWGLLALFSLYLLAGLLVIPTKVRFMMPLVPFLCLFAGAALDRLGGSRARRAAAA